MRSSGGEDKGEDSGGLVSAVSLRELALASTPSRQPPRQLTRLSSSRNGSMEMPAPVQRELTILRARAAEAEGEVVRLTEEAKRSRKRESEKDDALAELKAELDLAHADAGGQGAAGTDEFMMEIAEAGRRAVAGDGVGFERGEAGERGEGRPPALEEGGTSPKMGLGGVIKGFFSGGGSARGKSPGGKSPGGTLGVSGSGSQDGSDGEVTAAVAAAAAATVAANSEQNSILRGEQGKLNVSRKRALAFVKDFHTQIQGLEEKLHDSERQRAALERQLVHHSGGGGRPGSTTGDTAPLTVGLSAKLAAAAAGDTGELSTDAVAEAKKR